MEKIPIYSAFPYFYSVSAKRRNTVRYVIRMMDDIDGDALRRAVDTAFLRYPYLKVRYCSNRKEGWLEPNDADIVVVNSDKAVTLSSEESNYQLVALGYKDNNIIMYSFHGLFDGRGRAALLRTLLYYYCTFRYGETVTMDNVNLVDTPIDTAEYEDPLHKKIIQTLKIHSLPVLNPMRLQRMGMVSPGHFTVHCLKIPEDSFIRWCKQNDATPNTAVALLMSRAIASVHPDSRKKICAGVCCDLRPAVDAPKTHFSLIQWAHLIFDSDLFRKDFQTQCTAVRGQLTLQSDLDSLKGMAIFIQKVANPITRFPSLAVKKIVSRGIMSFSYRSMTFGVSYSGKLSFGSCGEHIRGLYAEPDTFGLGMVIEICVADGYVLLDIMQEWEEDVYFNAFLAQLEAIGMDIVDAYKGPAQYPPISL